jgi:L-ascorbate oxidase
MKSVIGFKYRAFLVVLVCGFIPCRTTALAQTGSKDSCAAVITGNEGGSSEYRPMLSFRPRGHGLRMRLAVDMTMRLSRQQSGSGLNDKFTLPIQIGDFAVYNAPFLHLVPQNGVEAYVRIPGDKSTDGIDCVVPATKFQDPEFVSRWGYAAARFEVKQGDTLDFTLRSKLSYLDRAPLDRPGFAPNGGVPCQSTNVHTHGMLVKPTKGSASTPFGDYVLTVTGPEVERGWPDQCGADVHLGHGIVSYGMHYRIAVPGKPNDPGNADPTVSGKHPSGLYWFHPHPHGYSAQQLRGGTTGLLTVGDLKDYAPDAAAVERAGLSRFMLLKDLQLVNVKTSTSANMKNTADFSYGYDPAPNGSDYCGTKDKPDYFLAGYCNMQMGANGVDQSKVWMFTLNGSRYPTIRAEAKAGEPLLEVWRIANASANATYRLRIVSSTSPAVGASDQLRTCQNGSGDRALMFQVLSKDGVSVATEAQDAGCLDEILLMPAARIEIKISAPTGGGQYDLVTEGYDSGGDHWPRMQLAHIDWSPAGNLAPSAAPMAQNSSAWSVTGISPSMSSPEQRERLLSAPRTKEAGATPIEHYDNPCAWANDWERAILLVKKRGGISMEEFGIISGVRPRAQSMGPLPVPVDQPSESAVFRNRDQSGLYRLGDFAPLFDLTIVHSPYSPSFGNPMDFGYVCTHLHPEPETWVVENWTDEDHNFHIHQSKFSALPAPPKVAPTAYFNFPSCANHDAPDGCGNEEVGEIRRFYLAAQAGHYAGANVYNDTVPVPRGVNLGMDANGPFGCNMAPGARGSQTDRNAAGTDLLCNPGRIAISIKFTRLEQVGDYVFHCHILEHEDKGMMALLHVDQGSGRAESKMPIRATPHTHMH